MVKSIRYSAALRYEFNAAGDLHQGDVMIIDIIKEEKRWFRQAETECVDTRVFDMTEDGSHMTAAVQWGSKRINELCSRVTKSM